MIKVTYHITRQFFGDYHEVIVIDTDQATVNARLKAHCDVYHMKGWETRTTLIRSESTVEPAGLKDNGYIDSIVWI